MIPTDVMKLRERVESDLPAEWPEWPGGWPGEIEAALLDAVFSMRAVYSGALRVVEAWRTHRGPGPLDDLHQLARYRSDPESLLGILQNRQRVPGGSTTKAEAVTAAAGRLIEAGAVSSETFSTTSAGQQGAYTGVPGLGQVTWTYLGMLLGSPGVKADIMVRRFVARALAVDDVPAETAERLVEAVAEDLGRSPTQLDHAIWSYQRSVRAPDAPGSG